MGIEQDETRERALVVAAHPDDPEFGCGGTTARWVSEGKEVFYLLCTRGDKGSGDRTMDPETLVTIRQSEQRAAAAALGVSGVTFLAFPDGELVPSLELREAIVREIRRLRPTAVFTHDPSTLYTEQSINHPDHRAVGQATLYAIYPTARDHLNFPQHLADGLEPHKVLEIYLWGSNNPNYWVNISRVTEQKAAALKHHVSQVGQAEQLLERIAERARAVGEPQGIPMAEAFRMIKMWR